MVFDPGDLIRVRELSRERDASDFYRAVRGGHFERLATGVYLPRAAWDSLQADDRYRARVHALVRTAGAAPVLGYLSAAAVWRLPMVTAWPVRVDVVAEPGHGRSGRDRRVHEDGIPAELAQIDGMTLTTLPRTLIDIARTCSLPVSLAMVDFALSNRSRSLGLPDFPVTIEELKAAAHARSASRGRANVRRVLELADGTCEWPGESVSRATMHVLGAPRPVLQQRFVDDEGEMFTDFWWPEFNVVGEFDGRGKYLKEEFLKPGETAADAVIREKSREDRIRALGPRFARWDWAVAWSPARLGARLRQSGVRW